MKFVDDDDDDDDDDANYQHITGWAVALTCCISHSAKYRKKADFDPSGSRNNPLTNFDETWHG